MSLAMSDKGLKKKSWKGALGRTQVNILSQFRPVLRAEGTTALEMIPNQEVQLLSCVSFLEGVTPSPGVFSHWFLPVLICALWEQQGQLLDTDYWAGRNLRSWTSQNLAGDLFNLHGVSSLAEESSCGRKAGLPLCCLSFGCGVFTLGSSAIEQTHFFPTVPWTWNPPCLQTMTLRCTILLYGYRWKFWILSPKMESPWLLFVACLCGVKGVFWVQWWKGLSSCLPGGRKIT